MRIVFVTEFYTDGMGYVENGLTKALAGLGQDVHVVTSDLNVYGNLPEYETAYRPFLGPAECPCGASSVDGYTVHRLPHQLVGNYVRIKGLVRTVARLSPDIIQTSAAAGLSTFELALSRRTTKGRLFSACHQSSSMVRPYLKNGTPQLSFKKGIFFLTRTLPARLAAGVTEKCYAVTEDCAANARRLYGVPADKITVCPLGVDTCVFHPVSDLAERSERHRVRRSLGFEADDIVCIYTGRFSQAKNPLLLAEAIARLQPTRPRYKAFFVGDGEQKRAIDGHDGCRVVPFMRHRELAPNYRAADIAVWPVQESISMLDAAACGLPLVVPERMGNRECVKGSGIVYREGSIEDLAGALARLEGAEARRQLGDVGAVRMRDNCDWRRLAERRLRDYSFVNFRR